MWPGQFTSPPNDYGNYCKPLWITKSALWNSVSLNHVLIIKQLLLYQACVSKDSSEDPIDGKDLLGAVVDCKGIKLPWLQTSKTYMHDE